MGGDGPGEQPAAEGGQMDPVGVPHLAELAGFGIGQLLDEATAGPTDRVGPGCGL